MTTIRAVTDEDLSREDQVQLLACLKQWQAEGQDNPIIPCDVDVDGDGTADGYGLSTFGELVYVSGVKLGHTVYESDGTGFEDEWDASDG